MASYIESQLKHIDPDENHIPQDIKIQLSSDHGITKWLNIDYDTLEAIGGALLEMEKETPAPSALEVICNTFLVNPQDITAENWCHDGLTLIIIVRIGTGRFNVLRFDNSGPHLNDPEYWAMRVLVSQGSHDEAEEKYCEYV